MDYINDVFMTSSPSQVSNDLRARIKASVPLLQLTE